MGETVFNEFATKLKAEISWLNNAYGMVISVKKKKENIPALKTGSEYKSVLPDESYGNYSFFDVEPVYNYVAYNRGRPSLIRMNFGLVVWQKNLNQETVKTELSKALGKIVLNNANYEMQEITHDSQGIFKKYYKEGFDNKYLMAPYGAVRFTGTLIFTER